MGQTPGRRRLEFRRFDQLAVAPPQPPSNRQAQSELGELVGYGFIERLLNEFVF